MSEKTFKIVGEDLSDGYHTFDELYEHRNTLFLALVAAFSKHAWYRLDYKDWFCVYLDLPNGGQISYHLKNDMLRVVQALGVRKEPEEEHYDGHEGDQVLNRLMHFVNSYCQWAKGEE